MVGRESGQVRLRVLRHSNTPALRSLVEAATSADSTLNTDEWRGYRWVDHSGRPHPTVNHAPNRREWARDDDGDGRREVHINTLEGLWTGLRNFLRPFRGVSKHYLNQYVAVFEWMHNLKTATAEFIRFMLRLFTPKPS